MKALHPIVSNRTQRHGSQRLELEETLGKSYRTLIEPSVLALHCGRVNRGRDEVESATPAAAEHRGKAMVVCGHTPAAEPEWLNRTINIDTGCVFGGKLTALRYREHELISVPAVRTYYESAKPFLATTEAAAPLSAQQEQDANSGCLEWLTIGKSEQD